MNDVEYWFSAESCFSCGSKLKRETRKDALVLICTKCGVINASIDIKKEGKE